MNTCILGCSPCSDPRAAPAGADGVITPQNPVKCVAVRVSDGVWENIQPCAQIPSVGNYGGLFFGFAKMARGWSFEIEARCKAGTAPILDCARFRAR